VDKPITHHFFGGDSHWRLAGVTAFGEIAQRDEIFFGHTHLSRQVNMK
jgi:hypothetical protein